MMKKPGMLAGGLVGALCTAPLISLFYLGRELAGLPFVPFDLFDWATRMLPGPVVTFGIDLMVSVIRALSSGETSVIAKTAEQLIALAQFLVIGVVAGMLLFAILRMRKKSGYLPGLILGAFITAPIALVSPSISRMERTDAIISFSWILVAFLAWGAALTWVYRSMAAAGGEPDVDDSSVQRLGRRKFIIRIGGASAVITVSGAVWAALVAKRRERETKVDPAALWSSNNPLPNRDASVKPAPGTRPEFTRLQDHYRIDINTSPPEVEGARWRLKIGGLVDRPLELTLDDLRNKYEPMHQFVTLSCISNPLGGSLISTTRWTGVSLQQVLKDVGIAENSNHLRIKSADGFHEVIALEAIRADERIMLTYAWDGVPLKAEHGFPLRIYIPDRYGMKQPKWIESIEAIEQWEEGYWVRRGWDREARVRATSVIDTIALNMMIAQADETTLVPIGGIAYAGARGISKVEIRVDSGEWLEAELRSPLSGTTWVIWRFNWPFKAGKHTFTVRCVDGSAAQQIETEAAVHPSGATGLHTTAGVY